MDLHVNYFSLGGYGGIQIDPQVQQWFMAVDADRSGRISAHELQQALVNGNWSHFNPETCRLMIGKRKVKGLFFCPRRDAYSKLLMILSVCPYVCLENLISHLVGDGHV